MKTAESVLDDALQVKSQMDEDLLELMEPSTPNSWVDDSGVRHAVVWNSTIDTNMRIQKQGKDWIIIDTGVF